MPNAIRINPEFRKRVLTLLWKLRIRKPVYNPQVFQRWEDAFASIDVDSSPWSNSAWIRFVLDKGTEGENYHTRAFTKILAKVSDFTKFQIWDVGGGSGETYRVVKNSFAAKELDPPSWVVIDSGPLVREGEAWAEREEISSIKFIDYELSPNWLQSEEQKPDLVLVSSTLHYMHNPLGFLKTLVANVSPDFIVLTRLPLHENAPTIRFGVQNVRVALRNLGQATVALIPPRQLLNEMKELGYEIRESTSKDCLPLQNYFEVGCSDSTYEDVRLHAIAFQKSQLTHHS